MTVDRVAPVPGLPEVSCWHWFWAKLGRVEWPTTYHPVVCHLLDVGAVAQELWTNACRKQVRDRLATAFCVEPEQLRSWLAFWVAAHDIGKVTPCFQFQGSTAVLRTRLSNADFTTHTGLGNPHHTETGTKVLADLLARDTGLWPALSPELARKVAQAVGGHHGSFPIAWHELSSDVLGDERWAAVRSTIMRTLAECFEVQDSRPPELSGADQSPLIMLAGLTAVADWIGSNATFFPPVGTPELVHAPFDARAYFASTVERARQALARLGWLERPGASQSVRSFAQATGIAVPRPLQSHAVDFACRATFPQLLLIEAPMGEGKTEAAWYVADCWERAGGAGTYVALPTMATSNQMFERVKGFLERAGGGNLMLQHGKAALNDLFEQLKYAARLYDPNGHTSGVVAESWFASNKKHGLLAPFGVGTIDQALLSVLQTKHGFVRLFGLAGKCVILDEVHAYDAYMTTLLERLLRWLGALGCPVVLLSATLPAEKRVKLLEAYCGSAVTPKLSDTNEDGWGEYPRLVSVGVGGSRAEVRNFAADPTRKKKIRLNWVEDEALAGNIQQQLTYGGCAAVIRNTVGLAQDTYLRLKAEFANTDTAVELFHARFPFGRRKQIEAEVLEKYGKGPDGKPDNPKRPTKAILVATQVIEQSLDLDFDVMFTDVAPVDLVLQRAGRLHRHERGERGDPCLWLITPKEQDGLPDFGPSEWVYNSHILLRSWLALRDWKGTRRQAVHVPAELENLIEAVYTDAAPPTYLSEKEREYWTITRGEQKADLEREEEEAKVRQIKIPTYSGALSRICDAPLEEDDPSLHPAHQALTRLARPTVQLICLVRDTTGHWSLPHDGTPVDSLCVRLWSQGGVEDIKRLTMAELSVADGRVVRSLRGDPRRPTEWKDVGTLERHHLVEFVDGVSAVGEVLLTLDNEIGLRVIRAIEEEAE